MRNILKISIFSVFITLISCSKPTLPVQRVSKFVISEVYFDGINYYQVIDINNIGTRLNRIDRQWFTDTVIYKIGDTLSFKKP